jgi:hypothetical protein
MLRHIVMVRFKDPDAKQANAETFRMKLLALEETVPELIKMEVGLNVNTKPSAYDLVLISDFEDEAGLDAYRIHPEHVKVVKFMKSVASETAVVDYIL